MESLFYYFRLEEQIPEDHLLRLVDRHVDFRFVREWLKSFYSPTGRPSIDPEVLLHLVLMGYLYGITSERRLIEEVRMHWAYRLFTRLGFEQEIPDHSTFSKNRHGRFRQSGVFQPQVNSAEPVRRRRQNGASSSFGFRQFVRHDNWKNFRRDRRRIHGPRETDRTQHAVRGASI